MNERVTNFFFFTGDKFMPEMYLRQPGFTQACNQEFFGSELGHFDKYQPTTRDRTTPRGKVTIFWLGHP